jgi:hypothetical protein
VKAKEETMRYLLVMVLVVSLFVSACAAKLPEDVDHPCPNGTELMVRNLGDYMIGHQTVDGTCVVERDGAHYVAGLERFYDAQTGEILAEIQHDKDGDVVGDQIYFAHTSFTSSFFAGSCGGQRVQSPAGNWFRFDMTCPGNPV